MAKTWLKVAEDAWRQRTNILARSAAMYGGSKAAQAVWYERRRNKKKLI